MLFNRIHVNGFGIWRDLTLGDLRPGLNVFVAPNEGGKTTLMAFVRAVLFGFRRRGDSQRYEPLRGGAYGGYLEVEADGRKYRLTRSDDGSSPGALQVSDANGGALPEAKLRELLHNTTEMLFQNVFAFGLTELQRLETLQTDEIAGHIYSAGMAAGGRDPISFRKDLESAMAQVWLPRGRKQRIPRLLGEIQELQRDIEPLQQLPEEHATLLKQAAELRARVTQLDELMAERQAEFDAANRAQRAWRDYEDALAAESALTALGVPTARALRSDTYGEDETPMAGDAGEDSGAIPIPETGDLLSRSQQSLLDEAGRIRSLLAAAPRLRELRAAIHKHGVDTDAADAGLQSHLKDLGKEWNIKRIRSTPTAIEQREAVRQFAERLRNIEGNIEALGGRAAEANEAYETVVTRREAVSRGAVMFTWVAAVGLTLVSAVFVPEQARIVTTAGVGAVGSLAGIIMVWLRHRGRQQLSEERLAAAERETRLWEQHAAAEKEMEELDESWRDWLRERNLSLDLTTDGALDLLDRIREAQEVDRQGREASLSADRATNELTVACGRVNALLENLGRTPVPIADGLLDGVEPILGQLESLQADLEAAEDRRIRLRTVVDQYAQAQAALRAVAGEEGPQRLRSRLESLDPDQIERLVQEAEAAVAAVVAQRDGVNEQLGGVNEHIAHLERDTDLAEALLAREERRASLAAAVQDWAAYAVTAALFDQAKQVYEAERQPEVMRLASRYFEAMTRGAYVRVLAPLGETRLEVEEQRTGKRKGPEALSRGTREQLYLSMRLALAAVYADQAVALPLVADDILVNFDDQRAEATAYLLGAYAAKQNQVLAFTCHARLADVFAEQAPETHLIELPSPH